jgi:hypothetical protein
VIELSFGCLPTTRYNNNNDNNHYRNPGLCRVSAALLSAFYRALGKEDFAERRTRQSPALGNELVCRVQDTRHRRTLGKAMFAECQTLVKGGARQSAVSGRHKADGRQPLPRADTRQRCLFTECQILDTRQSIFLFFRFCPPNFLWYVPTLCRPACIICGQL